MEWKKYAVAFISLRSNEMLTVENVQNPTVDADKIKLYFFNVVFYGFISTNNIVCIHNSEKIYSEGNRLKKIFFNIN